MSDRDSITYHDGTTLNAIAFGEETHAKTYDEMIASFKDEIADGGPGRLTTDEWQEQLESFKERWTPEEYNARDCHDCGVSIGDYHELGCDSEECPRCGGQYFICECDTDEKRELWRGVDG